MVIDWIHALILAATSIVTATIALVALPMLPRLGPTAPRARAETDMVFLFDGEHLVDTTPEGQRFLASGPSGLSDWQRFCALVAPRFPGFRDRIAQLAQDGSALMTEAGGQAQIAATWLDGVARLALHLPDKDLACGLPDAQSLAAMAAELTTLRDVVEAMPTPAWQEDEAGAVAWANSAYLALVRAHQGDDTPLSWPLPPLFVPQPYEDAPRREVIHLSDQEERWFDCVSVTAEGARLHFALPADAAVRAETALRNFVQTLTKTFAELPIGLAVFNRARELVLFNPAMSDLFNLEPEFLTGRPTLVNLLDRLRETRMMPEPKDYRTWREQIVRLERDAQDGIFSDTWTLPSGQVYRVTGRPHPDGAVAFLFEDISAEMSLTRRFRGEIETGQAVIDSLDEAIAVFSSGGVLTMSNAPYSELWGEDPQLVMGTADIAGATARWQQNSLPEETGTALEMGRMIRQRKAWTGTLVHRDGRRLACRLRPVGGGAVLVGFRPDGQERSAEAQVSRAVG
ncbi:PAS-domain containing protein [Rhodovulum marinum]|uniref:PAS domain-containing protein n=1 Tax=Rhodovulum marinum TaxID=320662 RepID=A0A4R2PYM5_9RHOB|nr:PAS-domain containing protein [Rhodovulum marinum]TCP40308.1 PAS domain-containing protein [Rhodovulum marinum]